VEAFGDAVVAGKAPHHGDLHGPGIESFYELHQLRQAGLAQLVNGLEKACDQIMALLAAAVLFQQQVAEPLFETIDLAQCRELVEVRANA
jgi:hypothetical protein